MLHQTLKCSLARRPFQIGAGSHSHCYFAQNSAVKCIFPSLLKDAAATSDAYPGKAIHASILELGLQSDPYIASSLINAYVKCDILSDAWKVFVRLPVRYITIWNAIVTGYFQHDHWQQGFSSFRDMQIAGFRPDGYSITILLRACGDCLALEYGAEIHAYVVRNLLDPDVFLGTTLINMYAKCGKEHTAYRVFERETTRNICMWNAMIGGFFQNGCWEKSLELFAHMNDNGLPTESVTASVVLAACSSSETLDLGKMVHSGAVKRGYELDPYVSTSLCFVQEGLRIFRSVSVSFGITPTMDHCAGIVDLLGRAGHLDEAYDFIRTMHFEQKVDMSERSGHDSLLLNLYKEAGFMDKASDQSRIW